FLRIADEHLKMCPSRLEKPAIQRTRVSALRVVGPHWKKARCGFRVSADEHCVSHKKTVQSLLILEGRRIALDPPGPGRKVRTPQGAMPRNPGSARDTRGRAPRNRGSTESATENRPPLAQAG